jgi:hypothetical protein
MLCNFSLYCKAVKKSLTQQVVIGVLYIHCIEGKIEEKNRTERTVFMSTLMDGPQSAVGRCRNKTKLLLEVVGENFNHDHDGKIFYTKQEQDA